MKLEPTSTNYAVQVDLGQFARLLEDENEWFMETILADDLAKLDGVDSVEYNGHFGPCIYLRIDTEHDTSERHAEIIAIINKRLEAAQLGRVL